MVLDVVIHLLMSEEECLITPLGAGETTVKLEGADQGLDATGQFRFVKGIDVIESGVSGYALELSNIIHVALISKILGEKTRDIAVRNESQTEGEVVGDLLMPTLVEASEIRETNLLDVVGSGRELLTNQIQCTFGWWGTDVGEEVVGEEVPVTWLTRDAPHGDKVGGVGAISEELKTKPWSEWLRFTWTSSR
jgi:hypothetical protein